MKASTSAPPARAACSRSGASRACSTSGASRACSRQSWHEYKAAQLPMRGEPTHWHESPAVRVHRNALRRGIESRGFAVLDDVITKSEALGVRGCLKILFNRFGSNRTETHNYGIRSDAMLSVNEHAARVLGLGALASAIELLKAFGHELAAAFDDSLTVAPNVQVACFATPGSKYGRHGDNIYDPNGEGGAKVGRNGFTNWRAFTILLYCNAEWEPSHGGCLRIHDGGGVGPPPVKRIFDPVTARELRAANAWTDVEPLAGRVVLFNSIIHHEVLESWSPRFAVTLWVWREDDEGEIKFGTS